MMDCKGNTLNIGDEVVYVKGANSSASLATGKITRIYEGKYNEEECSVGSQTHISSHRIMKL